MGGAKGLIIDEPGGICVEECERKRNKWWLPWPAQLTMKLTTCDSLSSSSDSSSSNITASSRSRLSSL